MNSYAPADVRIADVEQAYNGEHKERVRKYTSELARDGLILRAANGVYRAKGADGLLGADAVPF